MSKRLIIVADTWNHTCDPEDQNGYTSRAVGRVGVALERFFQVDVSFHDTKVDFAALKTMKIKPGTAVCGVRLQDEATLRILEHFARQGAKVWLHGADPHWVNPLLPDRAALQTRMLDVATGVIASSEANAEDARAINPKTGKPFHKNVVTISDAMDSWMLNDPLYSCFTPPEDGAEMFVTGYPFHAPGFAKMADETMDYAAAHREYFVAAQFCTKPPNKSQAVAHKPSKEAGYLEHIKLLANIHGETLRFTNYSVGAARDEYERCDLVVIPNDPLNLLNAWQQKRYFGRGSQRIVDGLAHGKPVLVIEQTVDDKGKPLAHAVLPDAYVPFKEQGVILTARSLAEGLDAYRSMSLDEVRGMVEFGQDIVAEQNVPQQVAAHYYNTFFPRQGR